MTICCQGLQPRRQMKKNDCDGILKATETHYKRIKMVVLNKMQEDSVRFDSYRGISKYEFSEFGIRKLCTVNCASTLFQYGTKQIKNTATLLFETSRKLRKMLTFVLLSNNYVLI